MESMFTNLYVFFWWEKRYIPLMQSIPFQERCGKTKEQQPSSDTSFKKSVQQNPSEICSASLSNPIVSFGGSSEECFHQSVIWSLVITKCKFRSSDFHRQRWDLLLPQERKSWALNSPPGQYSVKGFTTSLGNYQILCATLMINHI